MAASGYDHSASAETELKGSVEDQCGQETRLGFDAAGGSGTPLGRDLKTLLFDGLRADALSTLLTAPTDPQQVAVGFHSTRSWSLAAATCFEKDTSCRKYDLPPAGAAIPNFTVMVKWAMVWPIISSRF